MSVDDNLSIALSDDASVASPGAVPQSYSLEWYISNVNRSERLFTISPGMPKFEKVLIDRTAPLQQPPATSAVSMLQSPPESDDATGAEKMDKDKTATAGDKTDAATVEKRKALAVKDKNKSIKSAGDK